MSATTPQTHDRQVDPAAAFEDLVLDHPDVCSSYFTRIKRDHTNRSAGEHGYDTEATDDFGAVVVRGDDYHCENVVIGTNRQGPTAIVLSLGTGPCVVTVDRSPAVP